MAERNEVSYVASFRIVPSIQQLGREVGSFSRLVLREAPSAEIPVACPRPMLYETHNLGAGEDRVRVVDAALATAT